MIVTIIMILTDWLMVGVTKLVYSCKVAYRQGMLFGVHVPGDAAELPEAINSREDGVTEKWYRELTN